MSVLWPWPRVAVLLLGFSLSASALTSDQEIDDLLANARQQDQAARGSERRASVNRIRDALRGRIAADSSTATALERLDRLEEFTREVESRRTRELAALRSLASAGDSTALRLAHERLVARFPDAKLPPLESFSPVAKAPEPPTPTSPPRDTCLPATGHPPCSAVPAAGLDTAHPVASNPAPSTPARCADGPPKVAFLIPDPSREVPTTDSATLLRVRIWAPCPLSKIEIRRDTLLARSLQLPLVKTGEFELEDEIYLDQDTRTVFLVACDTFGTCSNATLRTRHSARIAPWIPWTSGGLVLLGLLTGILALFRRPGASNRTVEGGARGLAVRTAKSGRSTEAHDQTDIQQTLRRIIMASEKELSRGPRLVSRMNTAIPAIEADPAILERAFSSLLRLPVARAGLRGTVLVATGRGPVNMEVVLEDNGPDLEDAVVKQLFDPAIAKLRERQGLDKELSEAAVALASLHGHLSAEGRIDGGLRLRIRLPLTPASGPRAASLLK